MVSLRDGFEVLQKPRIFHSAPQKTGTPGPRRIVNCQLSIVNFDFLPFAQKQGQIFVKNSEKILDKWGWKWYHIPGCAGKLRTAMR